MRTVPVLLGITIVLGVADAKSAFWNGPGVYHAACINERNCSLISGPYRQTSQCLRDAAVRVAQEEADDEYIGTEHRCIYLDKEPPNALEFDPR